MPEIRRGEVEDLPQIAAIQAQCPEAAQWTPAEYLDHDLRVAIVENRLAGFLVTRSVAPDEHELLNGRLLIGSLIAEFRGPIFLEVRESNQVALNLYKSMGFQWISRRPEYYECPLEAAIVMKFHSC
jgi:ribosomal-protein-alanine N-acetyltransferase